MSTPKDSCQFRSVDTATFPAQRALVVKTATDLGIPLLEKALSTRHSFDGWQMKRLIIIIYCLVVLIAGAASAWARCEQESFFVHPNSPANAPAHDHHSGSHHEHSHGTVIHCPTLDQFLLTATFSASKDHRVERLTHAVVTQLVSQCGLQQSYRSLHGPPGFSRSNNIPPYLFLSALRI
jgi:hypothetical protein